MLAAADEMPIASMHSKINEQRYKISILTSKYDCVYHWLQLHKTGKWVAAVCCPYSTFHPFCGLNRSSSKFSPLYCLFVLSSVLWRHNNYILFVTLSLWPVYFKGQTCENFCTCTKFSMMRQKLKCSTFLLQSKMCCIFFTFECGFLPFY